MNICYAILRDFLVMRYINVRFTYLLTILVQLTVNYDGNVLDWLRSLSANYLYSSTSAVDLISGSDVRCESSSIVLTHNCHRSVQFSSLMSAVTASIQLL